MSDTFAVQPPARTATAEVSDAIRQATDQGTPLRVRGRATWLGAGRHVVASRTLSLEEFTGVVDYVPGDLTLTVRAGTTLREIERITAAERQWLPLDPFGSPDATIGATVATDSAGPMAASFGSPRDAVLGLEAVTGTGAVIRGGGRVVKNVAGFDLCRLFTGSWGTLGAITEVTVRLRAIPVATVSIMLEPPPGGIDAVLTSVRNMPGPPLAAQLLSATTASAIGLASRPAVLVRLSGNDDSIASQRFFLARLGELQTVSEEVWLSLRQIEPADSAVLRMSRAPARLSGAWQHAVEATRDVHGVMLHACITRGIIRCVLPGAATLPADPIEAPTSATAAISRLATSGCTVVGERLSPLDWRNVERPSVADPLSRRVKATFDPMRVLNPGILGEGS